MIDAENEIFTAVAAKVRAAYPKAYVAGEYVKSPSAFPAVLLVENDNTMYERTADTGSDENHVSVLYEVNIYSNKKSGKKAECKAIAEIVDSEMQRMGFRRSMLQPIPNVDDATIYRMTGRYTAVIDKNKTVYRR